MKKFILISLPFVFTLMSCTQSQYVDNIIEFSGSGQTLNGNLFGENTFVKTEPLFIGDNLLVTTFDAPFFNVFSDDSLIANFGTEGRGPGEYTLPPSVSNVASFEDSTITFFLNDSKGQIDVVNITKSISVSNLSVSEIFTLPDELNHGLVDIFFYKENKFVGEFEDRMAKNVHEKTGVFMYDRDSENLQFGELFNYNTEPFHLMTEVNVNSRYSTVSQTNEKMAVATLYYPSLEIIDLNGLSSRKRFLLEDPPPLDGFTQEAYEMEELNQYVLDITSNDNALYLLYVDNDTSTEERKQMIKVIDWDGNPLEQYRIPEDQKIDQITIHSSGSPLVGVSWDQDALYRYEL